MYQPDSPPDSGSRVVTKAAFVERFALEASRAAQTFRALQIQEDGRAVEQTFGFRQQREEGNRNTHRQELERQRLEHLPTGTAPSGGAPDESTAPRKNRIGRGVPPPPAAATVGPLAAGERTAAEPPLDGGTAPTQEGSRPEASTTKQAEQSLFPEYCGLREGGVGGLQHMPEDAKDVVGGARRLPESKIEELWKARHRAARREYLLDKTGVVEVVRQIALADESAVRGKAQSGATGNRM